MRTEVITDMAEDDYHADPCDVPSLSSSMAHILYKSTPAHAWRAHPKLGGAPPEEEEDEDQKEPIKKHYSDGTIVHQSVLGGSREIVEIDADAYRTNVAKAERDEVLAAGGIPILKGKHAQLKVAIDALKARFAEKGITFNGHREPTLLWDDNGVQCRSRLDHFELRDGGVYIDDLKSSRSACPINIQKAIYNFGYDIQRAAYIRAVEANFPGFIGRVHYRWIFCELEPPYVVTLAESAGSYELLGNQRWRTARKLWARCLKEDCWPAEYLDTNGQVLRVEALPWHLRDAMVDDEDFAAP